MTKLKVIPLGSLLLATLLLPSAGCKKGSVDLPDVSDRPTAAGGLGFVDPSAPSPPRQGVPPPKVNPQPAPTPGNLPVGKTMDKLEHSGLPTPQLIAASRQKLQQIGQAYIAAAIGGSVNSKADLGPGFNRVLIDPIGNPYEVRWGIDPSKVASTTLLAWEKLPDSTGNRRAVQADGAFVQLTIAEFKQRTNMK